MMPAIKFDDQLLRRTEEIHDIRADRCLTAEVRAFDRQLLKRAPQDALMRRGVRAQFLRRGAADSFRDHVYLARGEITPPRSKSALPTSSDPPPQGEG